MGINHCGERSTHLNPRRITFTTYDYSVCDNLSEPSNSSMSDLNPLNPRPVLKLKSAPRKSPDAIKTSELRPQSKPSRKPAFALSDELKRRMQADMDALVTR
jgi:hypothetical protein